MRKNSRAAVFLSRGFDLLRVQSYLAAGKEFDTAVKADVCAEVR